MEPRTSYSTPKKAISSQYISQTPFQSPKLNDFALGDKDKEPLLA
jgi:hypothetical protein